MTDVASDSLRLAGLRRTPARVRVLATILSVARPVTHADLAQHPDLRGLDDITLYRTLATLDRAGLTHRVLGVDGAWRTCCQPRDQRGCPGNHAHFLCTVCGVMSCLTAQPMPRVEVPGGAVVEGRAFVVYGRCSGCRAAPALAAAGDDP